MKAFIVAAFMLLSAKAAVAQDSGSLEVLSEKYGFRDAHFETPLTSFKGMALVAPGNVTKGYTRATDSKKIGGAQISSIRYYFYKGKLSSVAITTKGLVNSRALLAALTAQYGEAQQPNEYLKKYYWDATRVRMGYDENVITNDATVIILSKPLAWQQEEDETATAKKAASDL